MSNTRKYDECLRHSKHAALGSHKICTTCKVLNQMATNATEHQERTDIAALQAHHAALIKRDRIYEKHMWNAPCRSVDITFWAWVRQPRP